MTIRLAQPDELPLLAAIERRAAARFGPDDLPPQLRGDTLPLTCLQRAQAAGLLWVAVAADASPAGFLAAEAAGAALHIREVSVIPEQGGQGLGRALLEAARRHGQEAGFAALTLTTFGHLPWNRPFYERLGFRVVAAEAGDEHLRQALIAETRAGLRNRVAMRRELP